MKWNGLEIKWSCKLRYERGTSLEKPENIHKPYSGTLKFWPRFGKKAPPDNKTEALPF
jgi:hypothetical protein